MFKKDKKKNKMEATTQPTIKEILKSLTPLQHRQLVHTMLKHHTICMDDSGYPMDQSPEHKETRLRFMFERWSGHVEDFYNESVEE